MRKPDPVFVRNLQAILPNSRPWWSDKHKKWMIVRDFHRRVAGMTEYDTIAGKTFIVEKVLEENGRPLELTGRVLEAIKVMKYNRGVKMETALRAIDEEDRRKVAEASKENYLRKKEFVKVVNRLNTSRTFS